MDSGDLQCFGCCSNWVPVKVSYNLFSKYIWVSPRKTRGNNQKNKNTKVGTYIFEYIPIEHIVIGEALTMEQHPEEGPQVHVVGVLIEAQLPTIHKVGDELGGVAATKLLKRGRYLLLADALVLLPFGVRLQALPGQ